MKTFFLTVGYIFCLRASLLYYLKYSRLTIVSCFMAIMFAPFTCMLYYRLELDKKELYDD